MIQRLSLRFYRMVLRLYPKPFKQEYGDLMIGVFEEQCHDTQGIWAWLVLWQKTIVDIVCSLIREYEEIRMAHMIDNYEINATLGVGSQAEIYRAYDPQRSMQVALKVFEPQEPHLERHFEMEGTIHQKLSHPNIPRCYAVHISEEKSYHIMDYINGKSLLEMLQARNRPFPPERVIQWALVACDILTYLHEQGYIYRDMKPANLMLDDTGKLSLIDFGIIVTQAGDGISIGTIGYAPPEQYKGNATVQSDIYALGATLHHLLTNRDPRHHEAHTFHDAPPSSYNSAISSALEQIILKATSRDPQERFKTIHEMQNALLLLQG